MLLQKLEHDGHSLFIVTQISIYLRLIHSLSLLPTCVFDFCFCLFRVIWIFAKVIWVFFFFMSLSFGRAQWRFDMLLHVICFLLGVSFVFFFFFFPVLSRGRAQWRFGVLWVWHVIGFFWMPLCFLSVSLTFNLLF